MKKFERKQEDKYNTNRHAEKTGRRNGRICRLTAMSLAAVLGAAGAAGLPAGSMKVEAAASAPAYDSKWTAQYPFLTLLKSALLNPYTNADGIYEQIKQGIKYKTVSEADILQLVQEGYRIPSETIQKLYTEGWISGYLYKTLNGLGYTADDFKAVFDPAYYVSANPAIAAAVQSGALPGDEASLFLNYLTCGIPAGLDGNSAFSFTYFEAHYPQIVQALGGDRMNEVMYYVMYRDSLGLKGNG